MKKIINSLALGLLLTVTFVPHAQASTPTDWSKAPISSGEIHEDLLKNSKATSSEKVISTQFEMSLLDSNGKTITLQDLKGKVVFMNFWATWCGPCIAEMASINQLYDKFKDNPNIVFVILEAEGNKDKAVKLMEKRKLDLPVYYPSGAIPQEFFRGRLPTTVILDKDGNIAHMNEGMADYSGQDIVDYLNEVIGIQP